MISGAEILVSPIITSFPKFSSTIILTEFIPAHTSTQTLPHSLSKLKSILFHFSAQFLSVFSIIMPYILKDLKHAMIERMASRQKKHESESHH